MKKILGGLLAIFTLLVSIPSCASPPSTTAATATPALTATDLPAPTPAPTIQPGDTTHELQIDGSRRTYQLHIPPGLSVEQTAPVVLFFHGLYSVSSTRSTTHFDELADANRFIVVYPVGIGASWNAGDCCGIAAEDQVDESAFVRQILADLGTVVKIDPKRIYATGSYNGAMLSYRLACEMPDTFAAIAPVAGTLFFGECQPEQPVSILHIHGLSDPFVPYEGGQSAGGGLPQMSPIPPVEQGIEAWTKWNECTGAPQMKEEGEITHTSYTCKDGTGIELYTLEGLEGWPLNFPTNQTIWDFFAAHPKQ